MYNKPIAENKGDVMMNKTRYSLAGACLLLCLCAGAALAEPAWVETEKGSLNIRHKANSKSTVVGRVPNGSEVELLETDGEWSKIEYHGKTGYVRAAFLTEEPPEKVQEEEKPEAVVLQTGGYARIETQNGALNMRSKEDAKAAVVARVPNGARVEVTEATSEWSGIVYRGKKGFVQTQYLALDTQMLGKDIYPDGDYLYVRAQQDAASRCLTAVYAAQPMKLLSIGEEWAEVSCRSAEGDLVQGYVSMADIAQWRETPGKAADRPVQVKLELSAQHIRLGEELDALARCEKGASCVVKVRRDGKTVMEEKPLARAEFSYRPREAGTYQMEIIASRPDGMSMGYEARFTVEQTDERTDAPSVYSQKDGWWLDKKYSRSNLDQSGCAIFALSHALDRLGKGSEKTAPDVLAKTYPMYLAESGTVTSNLLAAAGRDFGFSTEKEKIYDVNRIKQGFEEGAVYSFAIVSGHIALAAGLSEDGTKVHIVDSAPSVTLERIQDARLYVQDGKGGYRAVSSLGEIPGAKFYIETQQYGGLEYELDLEYVAGRGVRMLHP